MELKNRMKWDRAGVSALLVIVVVIVLVVAAAAAYIVLSGNDGPEDTLAPGTVMEYDFITTEAGVKIFDGTLEITIIGQSSKEYFSMLKLVDSTIESISYTVDSKESPPGATMTGTEEMNTFEGLKELEIWEYTDAESGTAVKAYVDPENGMSYRVDETRGTNYGIRTLKSYDLVWQSSYKESKAIGTTYEYALTVGSLVMRSEIRCVADCLNGQYGVVYDFSSFVAEGGKAYFLSDNVQGLPVDAEYTDYDDVLDTIDGSVAVQLWAFVNESGYGFGFFYDPESKIVYEIILLTDEGNLPFSLTKKP